MNMYTRIDLTIFPTLTSLRAVITGTDPAADKYQSIADLRGTKVGISRIGRCVRLFVRPFMHACIYARSASLTFGYGSRSTAICDTGSGSQIMASVMALQQGWTDAQGKVQDLEFAGA